MSYINSKDRLEMVRLLVDDYGFPTQLKMHAQNFEGHLHIAKSLTASWMKDHEEVDTAVVMPPLNDVVPKALHTVVEAACKVMSFYPSMQIWLGSDLPECATHNFYRLYYHMHEALLACLVAFYGYKEKRNVVQRYMRFFDESHGQRWEKSTFVALYMLPQYQSGRAA